MAGTCSLIPPAQRDQVKNALAPVQSLFQGILLSEAQLTAASAMTGPLAIITVPAGAISVLLTSVPYLASRLAVDCDPAHLLSNEAATYRKTLHLMDSLPKDITGFIPGFTQIQSMIKLVDPFLLALEQKKTPSLSSFTAIASMAVAARGVPPEFAKYVKPVLDALTAMTGGTKGGTSASNSSVSGVLATATGTKSAAEIDQAKAQAKQQALDAMHDAVKAQTADIKLVAAKEAAKQDAIDQMHAEVKAQTEAIVAKAAVKGQAVDELHAEVHAAATTQAAAIVAAGPAAVVAQTPSPPIVPAAAPKKSAVPWVVGGVAAAKIIASLLH